MVELSRCDMCLNSSHIISENGFHTICCLSEKNSLECITGKKDHYIQHPAFKMGGKE